MHAGCGMHLVDNDPDEAREGEAREDAGVSSHHDQYARRPLRRQRGVVGIILTCGLLNGCVAPPSTIDHAPNPTDATEPTAATSEAGPSARVLAVVDGDTLRGDVGGVVETVRLIGINAPESGECLAEAASRRLSELVADRTVTLEVDVSDRDRYGRLLRYVYVGEVLVNEVLVGEGLAIARRYEPDTSRSDGLAAAQQRAQEDGRGMWATEACGPSAAAEVVVDEIRVDPPGDDSRALVDEWVRFRNTADGAVDLSGWTVKDESASHRYSFPSGFVLVPDATVTLRTGCGTDSTTDLFWCVSGSAVWNNGGDTVFLLDPAGNVAVALSY